MQNCFPMLPNPLEPRGPEESRGPDEGPSTSSSAEPLCDSVSAVGELYTHLCHSKNSLSASVQRFSVETPWTAVARQEFVKIYNAALIFVFQLWMVQRGRRQWKKLCTRKQWRPFLMEQLFSSPINTSGGTNSSTWWWVLKKIYIYCGVQANIDVKIILHTWFNIVMKQILWVLYWLDRQFLIYGLICVMPYPIFICVAPPSDRFAWKFHSMFRVVMWTYRASFVLNGPTVVKLHLFMCWATLF